jgi:hypothetical protein
MNQCNAVTKIDRPMSDWDSPSPSNNPIGAGEIVGIIIGVIAIIAIAIVIYRKRNNQMSYAPAMNYGSA